MAGLRLRHGGRSPGDAQIRHERPARLLRRRSTLAETLWLPCARRAHLVGRGGRMKFTLSWLKSHLETDASAQEISETLTSIGLEVESLTNPGDALSAFKVAKVLTAERHP